jgi:restriction system protein
VDELEFSSTHDVYWSNRELLGAMSHLQIPAGFFMAQGGFTEDAKAFAKTNPISLIDGDMLLTMIQRLPDGGQQRLLRYATEGDFTTPTCPSCGTKMISRSGPRGAFWGCRGYPRCKGKFGMRRG